GITPVRRGDQLVDLDALEGLDSLRRAVFEHLEISRGQIEDRPAAGRRKHVHADEVRFDVEGLRRTWLGRCRRRCWRGGLTGPRCEQPGRETEHRYDRESGPL